MGYWSDYKHKNESFAVWAANKYNRETELYKNEVVATGLVNRRELYVAVKRIDKVEQIEYVYCMVILIRWEKGRHYNMMIKEMDEFCGPCYYNCPASVYNALTPVPYSDLSENWRETVKARYDKSAAINKLANNDIVVFDKAIKLRSGKEYTRFQIMNRAKYYFSPIGSSAELTLLTRSFLKDREWQVEK